MSILSNNISSSNNGAPSFHEFKKQASFFFKEKIKTARLVLTDVTPVQLLTEEATNGNPLSPDTRTLGSISKAAFELEDYTRIVEILHKRLVKFERKNWRVSYNSLIVVEHLLTHGPESVAVEFEVDKDVIQQMGSFQHIDEKGFNWGLALRKKSGRILKLLEKGPLLKEERDKARKLTRGIQGFGSFCQRSSGSSAQGILRESSFQTYGRSKSQSLFSDDENQENQFPSSDVKNFTKKVEESKRSNKSIAIVVAVNAEVEKPEARTSFKENMVPNKDDLERCCCKGESNPLLDGEKDVSRVEISAEDAHPFNETHNLSAASLLAAT
ncbi:epsin-3-like [Pyrus communis]|uniref:epsin-3-like n=1 Tax=Pyrus communis TaxID=23211 RepID=UPI0035C0F7EC